MAYGTLSTLDTLAASNSTVAAFGEAAAFEVLQNALTVYNGLTAEAMADLVEPTTDAQRAYGTVDDMVMDEIDQWGTPDAQKITAGVTVGFPLRLYGAALQWTRKYFQVASTAEIAAQVSGLMSADTRTVRREIRRAIFKPTNTTFIDRLINHVEIPVKALVNADGAGIPLGPQGESFVGATHTHYLATASLTNADLLALVTTVVEHYASGGAMLYINRAQEAAVRALADFVAYVDARISVGSATTTAQGAGLDPFNYSNRAIGVFGGAEVWVKPWIPASYIFAFVQGAPRPLALRTRDGQGQLELVYENEQYPLRARGYEREFGIGVWNRTNGAVLYTGGGTYVTPTLTA